MTDKPLTLAVLQTEIRTRLDGISNQVGEHLTHAEARLQAKIDRLQDRIAVLEYRLEDAEAPSTPAEPAASAADDGAS